MNELFPALCGWPLGPRQTQAVRRASSAVPPGADILYAFSLEPRLEAAVRIEVYGIEPVGMIRYLECAATPAVAAQAARVAPLIGGADRYHLSLDFAEEVLPRIGIECGWERRPCREPRWSRFLDRLVAAGLASPAKCDALLGWPGYDSLWTASAVWPEKAIGRGGYLVRCLSHVKLVSQPGFKLEAKAYLLFQYLRPARQTEGADGRSIPSFSANASACSA